MRLEYCDEQTVFDKGFVDGFNCAVTKIEYDFELPLKCQLGIPPRLSHFNSQTIYEKGYVAGFDSAISKVEAFQFN